jgi:hypothetical protein
MIIQLFAGGKQDIEDEEQKTHDNDPGENFEENCYTVFPSMWCVVSKDRFVCMVIITKSG